MVLNELRFIQSSIMQDATHAHKMSFNIDHFLQQLFHERIEPPAQHALYIHRLPQNVYYLNIFQPVNL